MKSWTLLCSLAISAGMCGYSWGQVSGTVKLDGKAPELKALDMSGVKECAQQHPDPVMEESVVADDKGDLKNVIVSIKAEEGQALPAGQAAGAPVIDQKGCMYIPHVVALQAGQTLRITSSDPFMHNVHSLAEINPAFNQAQPNKDPDGLKIDNLKSAEYFHVKCDVHGWMSAYIGVFEHPYFAVSGDDGKYSFKADALPDGEYTVVAWHEKYGTQEQKVQVKGGKATADFTFKAESAQANPINGDVKLASMVIGGKQCSECCSAPDRKTIANAAKN